VLVGAACDPTATTDACVLGAHCVEGSAGWTCAIDGTSGARCREPAASPSPCADGLACTGHWSLTAGRCRPARNEGDACDPTGAADACVEPAVCTAAGRCRVIEYLEEPLLGAPFIDACAVGTALELPHAFFRGALDRLEAPLELPFSFELGGRPTPRAWIGVNGHAALTPGDPPEGAFEAAMPFFTLDLRAGPGSAVCAATVGTAPNRQVVIEWRDVFHREYEHVTSLTFEVVLHETTNVIDFRYAELVPTAGEHYALLDGNRIVGLAHGETRVMHAGPVAVRMGLTFTPMVR
jgi:hypothetical protein